jgi:uncharacterized cofD-like protein
MKVVVVGGGHGASASLKAALEYADEVAGIITIADDGGSSGRLSSEMGVLPMGDIRNCLAALADNETAAEVFQYRFPSGDLEGHVLGNLWLAAVTQISESFITAIERAAEMLSCRGRVIPPTLEPVKLISEVEGELIVGQVNVASAEGLINYVSLDPPDPEAYPEAIELIASADQIILGPGSLYTSVLPPLLVPSVNEALRVAEGKRIFVCNIAAQTGETTHFDAAAHLAALFAHLGDGVLDVMVAHSGRDPIGDSPLASVDIAAIERLGVNTFLSDLVPDDLEPVHDHVRLAEALRKL